MAYRKTSGAPGSTSQVAPEYKSPQQSQEEAQVILASFGGRILEMLKAGGQKVDNLDRASVDRIKQDAPNVGKARGLTTQVPLGDVMAHEFAYGGNPQIDSYLNGMVYGSGAANLASRYALPAGGVMLAGKGLADLTNGLYDVASDTPIL